MTPKAALEFIRSKVVLPKGVSARIDPKQPGGVMIGTLDLDFFLAGDTLAHEEDYLLQIVNKSVKHLEDAMAAQEKVKAERAAQATLVKEQQDKRKRKK